MKNKKKLYDIRHICETCQFYEPLADKCKLGSIKNNLEDCEGVCRKWVSDYDKKKS